MEQEQKPRPQTQDLAELPFQVSHRFHLSLKGLAASIISLVGVTYTVVKFVQIEPLQKQLDNLKQSVISLETDKTVLLAQADKLRAANREIIQTSSKPLLIFPEDHASLLGDKTVFEWDYKNHENTAGYILEIRDISRSGPGRLISVARPETKKHFFDFDTNTRGEFLWRICPGTLVGGQASSQGPCSSTGTFRIYPNVMARVKETRRLLVGTTPTSYDAFVASDGSGGHQGFEVELIQWLTERLATRLQIAPVPKVEVVEIPWNRIFQAVENGEVDLAIRSITRSIQREREFRNIHFSSGYIQNHQIIIQREKKGTFPEVLDGATVGVKASSINEKAARFLAARFHWKVDSSYTSYGDIYQALREGRLDFALVDSVLAHKFVNYAVYQCGPSLDNELRPFYRASLGSEIEEYAIAIHESEHTDALRMAINEILASPEGKEIIRALLQKYGF